jgi:hypothetical protein
VNTAVLAVASFALVLAACGSEREPAPPVSVAEEFTDVYLSDAWRDIERLLAPGVWAMRERHEAKNRSQIESWQLRQAGPAAWSETISKFP